MNPLNLLIAIYTASNGAMLSGTPLQKTDLVEETIRARARACDENKRRLLGAYDFAGKLNSYLSVSLNIGLHTMLIFACLFLSHLYEFT